MSIPDNKVRITITIDRQAYEFIKSISGLLGSSPAKLSTTLIYIAFDDTNILDKLNMTHISNKLRFLKKAISDAAKELTAKGQ